MMYMARDLLLVRIPLAYDRLFACQGLLLEQEAVFTYTYSTLLNDAETGLRMLPYTERAILVCVALLLSVYI